jgi:uncharacterized protein (DUF1501 family)
VSEEEKTMRRRDFLKQAVPASTLPFLIGGFSLRTYGRSPFLEALVASATQTDRVLVLVQLNGGNDGLNTVIPLDQYSALSQARANILIDSTKVLQLTATTGLHPAMSGLQNLYTNGKIAVVQSVSYPNPNFSHFRAADIWLTGADYNQIQDSGVLGRYLDLEFPGFPVGYPNSTMPDPLAISIGSLISPGLQGPTVSMGMAIADPTAQYILPGGGDTQPPDTPAGHELTFVRQVAQQTQVYSAAVKTASSSVTNKSTLYPTGNSLADQLKIVARLVAGGLKTRIYVVNIGGFDTHSAQVDTTDHSIGAHATLLGRLSSAITAFQDDLVLLGADGRVIGMTFSEFGRRVKSNASGGTDHGTAEPMIVFGKLVNPGVVGTNPVLTTAGGAIKDNLDMQFDFRQVYGTILRDWFGASPAELQSALATPLYTGGQSSLGLITPSAVAEVELSTEVPERYVLQQNYPNPFNPSTTIRYELPRPGSVLLEVFNASGERVAVLDEGEREAGVYTVRFDASRLASGVYFYRLRAGGFNETRKALLVR